MKELKHSVFVKRVQGWLKSDPLNSLKEFYEVARDGWGGGLTLHRQVLNISFKLYIFLTLSIWHQPVKES